MRRLPLELIERLRALRPTPETPKDHVGFVATAAGVYFLIAAVIEVWRFLAADIITPLWRMLRPWLFVLALALVTVSVAEGAEEAICADAAVFFCDNFEDRTATTGTGWAGAISAKNPAWDMSDFTGIHVISIAQGGVAFEGTKSMVFHYPACSWVDNQGTSCGVGYGFQYMTPSKGEFYIRMYVYWASGFTHSTTANKIINMSTVAFLRRPWVWHYRGDMQPTLDDEGDGEREDDQNTNLPAVAFQNGQWYCLEAHFRRNGSTSVLEESWIDSVLKFDYPTASGSGYGNENWAALMISGYWNTTSGGGSKGASERYFDNIVMSTARIGCLGASASPHGFILRASLPILLGLGAVLAYAMRHQAVA